VAEFKLLPRQEPEHNKENHKYFNHGGLCSGRGSNQTSPKRANIVGAFLEKKRKKKAVDNLSKLCHEPIQ
jgi:hypothetical protein